MDEVDIYCFLLRTMLTLFMFWSKVHIKYIEYTPNNFEMLGKLFLNNLFSQGPSCHTISSFVIHPSSKICRKMLHKQKTIYVNKSFPRVSKHSLCLRAWCLLPLSVFFGWWFFFFFLTTLNSSWKLNSIK